MKARHDFSTDFDYKKYLRIYFAGKNMSCMLLTDSLPFNTEEIPECLTDMARTAIACSDALLKELNIEPVVSHMSHEDSSLGLKGTAKKHPVISVKSTKDSVKKIKAEFESYVHMGSVLLGDKKYQEALNSFEKALFLDPNSKHVQADIKRCKQWINALKSLEETQDSDFKRIEVIKEQNPEFTTKFPTLE